MSDPSCIKPTQSMLAVSPEPLHVYETHSTTFKILTATISQRRGGPSPDHTQHNTSNPATMPFHTNASVFSLSMQYLGSCTRSALASNNHSTPLSAASMCTILYRPACLSGCICLAFASCIRKCTRPHVLSQFAMIVVVVVVVVVRRSNNLCDFPATSSRLLSSNAVSNLQLARSWPVTTFTVRVGIELWSDHTLGLPPHLP